MRILLKDDTIKLHNVTANAWTIVSAAARVWQRHGLLSLTITSARDGAHIPSSFHYTGNAIDLRSRDLPDSIGMAGELTTELGPDYDVILEKDHIHVEYHPLS